MLSKKKQKAVFIILAIIVTASMLISSLASPFF